MRTVLGFCVSSWRTISEPIEPVAPVTRIVLSRNREVIGTGLEAKNAIFHNSTHSRNLCARKTRRKRQGDCALRNLLRDREISFAMPLRAVERLQMQRRELIVAADTVCPEMREESIAGLLSVPGSQMSDVYKPADIHSILHRRRPDVFVQGFQFFLVPFCDLPALVDELRHAFQLADAECALDVTQTVVESERLVLQPGILRVTPLVSLPACAHGDVLAICHDHPAFAGGHLLVWVERECAAVAECARHLPPTGGAERFAAVLDQRDSMFFCDCFQGFPVGEVPEDIHSEYRLCFFGDGLLDFSRINAECCRLAIDKTW